MVNYTKREVQQAIDQAKVALKTTTDLNAIQPDRSLSIAATELQTGILWLQELHNRTPENFG